jgi:hypothetical protein
MALKFESLVVMINPESASSIIFVYYSEARHHVQ